VSTLETEEANRLSGEDRPGIEQRRFVRTSRACYARVEVINPQVDHVSHGLTQDICAGGVKVLSFRPIPPDANVIVHIGCEDEAEALKMTGSVVWTSQTKDQQQWLAGISFSESHQQALSRLQQLSRPSPINP
jgi:hypothetical protein